MFQVWAHYYWPESELLGTFETREAARKAAKAWFRELRKDVFCVKVYRKDKA